MNKQYRKLDKQIAKSAKSRNNNSFDKNEMERTPTKDIQFRELLAKENLIKIPWQQSSNNIDLDSNQKQKKNMESNFDLLSDWQEENKLKNNILKGKKSQRFENRLYSKYKYKSASKIENNTDTNIKVTRPIKKIEFIPPVTVSFEFIKNKTLTKNLQINNIMQQIIKNREKQQIKLLEQEIKSINVNNSATFLKSTPRLTSAFIPNRNSKSVGLHQSLLQFDQDDCQINPTWQKHKFPIRKRRLQKPKQISSQKLFIENKSQPIQNLKKSINKVKKQKQKVQMKRYSARIHEIPKPQQIPILGKKLIF